MVFILCRSRSLYEPLTKIFIEDGALRVGIYVWSQMEISTALSTLSDVRRAMPHARHDASLCRPRGGLLNSICARTGRLAR